MADQKALPGSYSTEKNRDLFLGRQMLHNGMVYLKRLLNSDPILTVLVYDQVAPLERCNLLLLVSKCAESFLNGNACKIRPAMQVDDRQKENVP